MKYLRTGITALGLALCNPASADVFRCEVDGKVVFSQTPCAPDAQAIELRPPSPSAAEQGASAERAADLQAQSADALRERRRRQAIQGAQREIRRLEAERDRALAGIDGRRAAAANNLAGAVYQQALAAERQSVIDTYAPRIQAERDRITRLEQAAP